MPASDISAPQRFSLTLDPGLVLERMMLRRLAGLERKRGQDWLRALLVQGFLAEGRWLRYAGDRGGDRSNPERPNVPPTDFAGWLEGSTRSPERAPEPAPVTRGQAMAPVQPTGDKPFAHLRKVVG